MHPEFSPYEPAPSPVDRFWNWLASHPRITDCACLCGVPLADVFGATFMTWKLKRVRQCEKCPWKVSTDPLDIPGGYSVNLHRGLAGTIAEPGSLRGTSRVMACHEHHPGEEAHCVGWLMHQLGPGNNIALRLQMMSCGNRDALRIDGPQHTRFEDTLPEEA